ncbi:MAG: hypothetical protein AABW58_01230 [Nanoarchaeota archaeon]
MQRLKQAIRRVAALGVGVAMLGATVTGAMAQAASLDLANLPEPFVSKEGVYNDDTALVVGSKADVSDTLGIADVSAKLQFLSKQAVSTSGTVSVTGGVTEDVPLDLGIANTTAVALDFSLEKADIGSFFDGTINFLDEDIEAHDELVFLRTSPSLETSLTSSDDDYESNVFLEAAKGAMKYYYVFDDALNVSKATSSDPLEIKFLGKTLKITSVEASQNKFTATVGTEYFMKVGDSITVEGKKVTLQNVGSSGAVLVDVDGKVDTIDADSSKVVNNVEIKNDDTFYATSKSERSAALIVGKNAQDTFADGDPYVGENKNNPDWTWKLGNLGAKTATTVSSGATDPTGPFIGIQNDFVKDDDTDNPVGIGECYSLPNNYAQVCLDSLTVPDTDYLTVTLEYQSSVDTAKSKYDKGSSSSRVIHISAPGTDRFVIPAGIDPFIENGTLNDNDVKTSEVWIQTEDVDAPTSGGFALFYKDENQNPNIVYIGNLSIANMSITNKGGLPSRGVGFNSTAGDYFLKLNYLKTKDTNVRFMLVPTTLNTTRGLIVGVVGDSTTELDSGTDDFYTNWSIGTGNWTALGLTAAKEEAAELTWATSSASAFTQLGAKDEDHRSKYGIILRDPKSNGASDRVVFEVPGDQVQANVVVKGSATTVSGGGVTYIPAKITVNTLKDTEVSDPSAYNLILVGGPCADPLVERVSGLGVSCGAWPLSPGEAMLKLGANGDKVALLVAGTDAADTRMAAKVFSDFEDYKLSGTQATLAGSINAPTVKSRA